MRWWSNIGLSLALTVLCLWQVGSCIDARLSWVEMLDIVSYVLATAILLFNIMRRNEAEHYDGRWRSWVVCLYSVIYFILYDVTSDETGKIAYALLLLLHLLGDSCLLYLGRSFSVLPAKRKIKTGWLYRYVRHPAYAIYAIGDIVYVLAFPSLMNVVILVTGTASLVARLLWEERILSTDSAYVFYSMRVRWRLIPFVF